jgi:hypothetical protein
MPPFLFIRLSPGTHFLGITKFRMVLSGDMMHVDGLNKEGKVIIFGNRHCRLESETLKAQ